jgi:hypothetical protein
VRIANNTQVSETAGIELLNVQGDQMQRRKNCYFWKRWLEIINTGKKRKKRLDKKHDLAVLPIQEQQSSNRMSTPHAAHT